MSASRVNHSLYILLILCLSFACSKKIYVPSQYEPYYNSKGQLIAKKVMRCNELRLPSNIGDEILTSYMHNNLIHFTDTIGVDETHGIFEFEISYDGHVEKVTMVTGNIPNGAQGNLIEQFSKMHFQRDSQNTKWYLPIYLEIAYGKEVYENGQVFEGKEGYMIWMCYYKKDVGLKRQFK